MKILLDSLKMAGEDFQSSFSVADLNEPDQSLVYVNKQFIQETGYSFEEALQNNCRFLQGAETDQEVTKQIKHRITNSEFCYADIINYKKDGTKFLNRLLLIPIHVNKVDVRYYIGIQLDLSHKLSNSCTQAIYDLGSKEKAIMSDLESIINYYRSLEYLDLSPNSQKLADLGLSIKAKINNICQYIQKI